MSGTFDFITDRLPKSQGLTMVSDPGMSVVELEALCEVASDHIHWFKFGMMTAVLTPAATLKAKINCLKKHNILTAIGGTYLEWAIQNQCAPEALQAVKALDLDFIEVSNSGIDCTESQKLEFIAMARDLEMRVLSEVGKRDCQQDKAISLSKRIADIHAELEAGAEYVVIEANEAGNLGVFDSEDTLREDTLSTLLNCCPSDQLIFEAPQSSQQRALLKAVGPELHLGNIKPQDVLKLTSMRWKLHPAFWA